MQPEQGGVEATQGCIEAATERALGLACDAPQGRGNVPRARADGRATAAAQTAERQFLMTMQPEQGGVDATQGCIEAATERAFGLACDAPQGRGNVPRAPASAALTFPT